MNDFTNVQQTFIIGYVRLNKRYTKATHTHKEGRRRRERKRKKNFSLTTGAVYGYGCLSKNIPCSLTTTYANHRYISMKRYGKRGKIPSLS